MKIAAHHVAGTAEHRFASMLHSNPDYTPTCAWPDECMVQWGHGHVPAVPFFEAFPPGTFIRGEGETIAAAELQAFEMYQRDIACNHVWGRDRKGHGSYTNGAAFCRKCGGFRSRMFREVVVLGHWRQPLTRWEYGWLEDLENDHEMNAHMDRKYPADAPRRRRSARLLRIRFNLYGIVAPATEEVA